MTHRLHCCLVILLIWSGMASAQQPDSLKNSKSNQFLSDSGIQVLYEKRPRQKLTAAVSDIQSDALQKTVSTTYGGWLTGRLAGLYTNQSSGEPGADDVSVFLRGAAPLILVDGTPQSFPSINPEQVESITLLKDAVSTAMLGMRGGNGAILITTKKGSRYQPQRIEVKGMYGVQQPTQMPRFLSAYDYARLYNEALTNDGMAPVYTQADLDAYANGSDPVGHPNVNWQNQVLKDAAPFSRYDLSISGGSKTTNYFVNLDYLNQQGLLKKESFNPYNTNADYKRYIIRSNINTDLTNSLTASLNLFGRIQTTNQPGAGTSSIFDNLRNTPNNAYPVMNSDSSLGGNLDYQSNLYGQSVLTGYNQIYERDFKVDLSLKAKLDALTKGLWIKASAALNAYQSETVNRSKTFAVYREASSSAGAKSYTKYGNTGDQQNTIGVNSQNRLFYTELSAGYNAQLTGPHHLDALVVFNNDYRMVNTDLPFNYTGAGLRVSYDYANKYLVDIAAGYNGTERFPESKRYGLFPAIGLGWNMLQEDFLQGKPTWLDEAKLRVSYGRTGNANVGYYDYYQYYRTGNGYGFGSTVPSSTTTLQQSQLANPNITWEKVDKLSAGIDLALFRHKLSFTADYYNNKYFDLVQSRANGSDIFGTTYMRENIGSNRFTGWEFQADWNDHKGSIGYNFGVNLTIQKSKVLYMAEPQRMYDYQLQTGLPVGQAYGYVAEELFSSQADITGHAFQGATIVPGDIKYKDLNNDGVIDANDQTAIGNTKPFIFYGINGGLRFKGLELSFLLQGAANNTYSLSNYRGFQNNGKAQGYDWQLHRWTPTNTANATYPRLWLGSNANNTLTSSYWIHKADYLRVKNIELAYNLPARFSGKLGLSLARVFVTGTNLLTFSSLNDLNIDPEGSAGNYPIMKTIAAGISIHF